VLRRGAIAAIVGDGPAPRSTASTLRRHDRTLRELAARFPAILPARFGTALSEDELLFILSSRRASLARTLSSVHGRVQMTIRVMTRGGEEPPPGHPLGSAASGRDYLIGKARDAAAARNVAGFEPIRKAVARLIKDERVDQRVGVASIYHLIPRGSVEAYRRGIREAARAAGIRLVVSGPWPPYAFAAD
jgi:alkylated DNA nucleotide flippase Atl1